MFMPGNNRRRVARPFGRRFINSEVTHAFTTGKFQHGAGNKPGYVWPPQAFASREYPGLHPRKPKSGFLGTPRLSPPPKFSRGTLDRSSASEAFPNSCLVLRGYASAAKGAAPADILFRTLHFACFGRKYLPSSATDCVLSLQFGLTLIRARVPVPLKAM